MLTRYREDRLPSLAAPVRSALRPNPHTSGRSAAGARLHRPRRRSCFAIDQTTERPAATAGRALAAPRSSASTDQLDDVDSAPTIGMLEIGDKQVRTLAVRDTCSAVSAVIVRVRQDRGAC
jgi:hypothetical protein